MARMTFRLCKCCGDLHDLAKPWPHNCISHFGPSNRSALSAPRIVRDTMGDMQSMVTGRWHDSKSGLRAEYRREGVLEVGNETVAPREIDAGPPLADIEKSVAAAYQQLDH